MRQYRRCAAELTRTVLDAATLAVATFAAAKLDAPATAAAGAAVISTAA